MTRIPFLKFPAKNTSLIRICNMDIADTHLRNGYHAKKIKINKKINVTHISIAFGNTYHIVEVVLRIPRMRITIHFFLIFFQNHFFVTHLLNLYYSYPFEKCILEWYFWLKILKIIFLLQNIQKLVFLSFFSNVITTELEIVNRNSRII